jgi:hypothetical protein
MPHWFFAADFADFRGLKNTFEPQMNRMHTDGGWMAMSQYYAVSPRLRLPCLLAACKGVRCSGPTLQVNLIAGPSSPTGRPLG